MLTTREDCWPNEENPCERYLYVDAGDGCETRIEIMADRVTADDTDIIFGTEERLEEWVEILRLALRIKAKQDAKGWRPRE